MNRTLGFYGAGTGLLLFLSACGAAANVGTVGNNSSAPTATPPTSSAPAPTPTPAPATPAPATGATVSLRIVGNLGGVLVDASGKTLYLFAADTGTTSTCSGSCVQNWPPLTTMGTPQASGGVSQPLLGTTTRGDGSMQVTYNGHPLYGFIADSAPGMANGENLNAFGARWEVVNAAGAAVVR